MPPYHSEYVGYIKEEAKEKLDQKLATGALAWLEESTALGMNGHQEWWGFNLCFFSAEQVLEAAEKVRSLA